MQYPNRLQACLLFDRPFDALEAAVRDFARIEEMKTGATFNVPETNPDRFYRLFNGREELMLTFECVDGPANAEAFRGALSSTVTGIVTPDIRERIARTRSHVLVEVSHGVLGGVENNAKIAAMFENIGMPKAGATQAQFHRRLEVLALMSRVLSDHAMPSAVHWTQSDQLISGEAFDPYAAMEPPGPLHLHPYLFGPRPVSGEPARVGIRTFGARHWLGRELLVQPHVVPWAASYEVMFALLRMATVENGYVIPDGDTFGPEDRSWSYRVVHHDVGADIGYAESEPADIPFYELVPLKHTDFGFVDPAHVPEENRIDDKTFSGVSLAKDQDGKAALANEWAQKRRMAEAIGGKFEVRAESGPPPAPPEPVVRPTPSHPGLPSVTGRSLRARVFGRKGT
jgi:hypothetical protein